VYVQSELLKYVEKFLRFRACSSQSVRPELCEESDWLGLRERIFHSLQGAPFGALHIYLDYVNRTNPVLPKKDIDGGRVDRHDIGREFVRIEAIITTIVI